MRIWTGLLLAFAMFASLPARADDDSPIPPNAPPDIVRILEKTQSGQQPTPDETKRLMEWLSMVQSRQGAPGAPFGPDGQPTSQPEGIPARFTFDIHYTWTYSKGKGHGSGHLSENGTGLVFAVDGGNANFDENLANPKAEVAQFRLQPNIDGGGTYSCQDQIEAASTRREGRLSTAALLVVLESTGGGNLWPHGSSMGGDYEGTSLYKNRGDSSTTHDKDELARLGCEFHDSPFPYEAHVESLQQGNPTKTPEPRMGLSYAAFSKAVRGGGTATISGTESYDESDKDETWKVTTSVSITIRPKNLQLVIEPDDRGAYEKWVPMPDKDESGAPELFGNPPLFEIHAALHDPAKGPIVEAAGRTRPDADRGGRIDFLLSDVSQNKGVAMNFPAFGKGDDKPDLFFPEKKQPAGIHWVDETHVYTDSENAVEATAVVASRDTAAYGKVSATCDSLGLTSKSWESDDAFFLLPRDKNGNHVADSWERDEHVFEKNLPADWDDEDKPSGMQTRGDGLTLFEEYRGFIVEIDDSGTEKHRRLSPSGKKLFVHAHDKKDGQFEKEGARRYGAATGIEPVFLHDPSRMALAGDASIPHWVNFQESPFAHQQTFALWIDDRGGNDPGFTQGLDDFPAIYSATPGSTQMVNVSRFACDSVVTTMTKWLSLEPLPAPVAAALAKIGLDARVAGRESWAMHQKLVDEMLVFTTMHEMGHATGGRHHHVDEVNRAQWDNQNDPFFPDQIEQDNYSGGDHACPMRYWHFGSDKTDTVLFLVGRWDPSSSAPGGGAWKFCPDDWPRMSLKP